ncbi:unnamed protein product [Effrenium voratum]|nr:unnamed protein product [Effrenium voratum]
MCTMDGHSSRDLDFPGPGRRQALAQETQRLAELQRRLENGYQDLNARRRNSDALEQGMERQHKALQAIQAESASMSRQLSTLRAECQEQASKNAGLSAEIAQHRKDSACSPAESSFSSRPVARESFLRILGDSQASPKHRRSKIS